MSEFEEARMDALQDRLDEAVQNTETERLIEELENRGYICAKKRGAEE